MASGTTEGGWSARYVVSWVILGVACSPEQRRSSFEALQMVCRGLRQGVVVYKTKLEVDQQWFVEDRGVRWVLLPCIVNRPGFRVSWSTRPNRTFAIDDRD